MIRRLQPGYNGGVGALHSDDRPKIRYCQRCQDLFQVQARLGPKILLPGVPKPSDYDLWLECRNCGSDGKQAKSQGVEKKPKQRIGRGSNPRLKGNKWEIKESELKEELKSGAVLMAYSTTDPTEPVV